MQFLPEARRWQLRLSLPTDGLYYYPFHIPARTHESDEQPQSGKQAPGPRFESGTSIKQSKFVKPLAVACGPIFSSKQLYLPLICYHSDDGCYKHL